jgi:hypothetical protein
VLLLLMMMSMNMMMIAGVCACVLLAQHRPPGMHDSGDRPVACMFLRFSNTADLAN